MPIWWRTRSAVKITLRTVSNAIAFDKRLAVYNTVHEPLIDVWLVNVDRQKGRMFCIAVLHCGEEKTTESVSIASGFRK